MSERSYTLPRNFRFQPQVQISLTSLGQQHGMSIPNLQTDLRLANQIQRFGSVPANLQTIPMRNVPSIPLYPSHYPYNYPSRSLSAHSNYPYQVPIALPSQPQIPQMNWGRRNSAFYPVSNPNPYVYSGVPVTRSASYPIQHVESSPSRRQSMTWNPALNSDQSSNSGGKIKLANKLELEEITLSKKSRDSYLGLVVELLPESLDQDAVIVVHRVTVGGLCQKDGRVKRGDRILKVNGYRVKDFDTSLENLRQLNVTITVARVTKEFRNEHLRPVSCSLFGYKPTLKPSKVKTSFPMNTPRQVKGVNEAKLEVEMISLCRRLERVPTGSKKAQWHIYNVDKDEYIALNKDKQTIKKYQKKATKQQSTKPKKNVPKVHLEAELNLLEQPLSKEPKSPPELPKAAYHSNNTSHPVHLPMYRPLPMMQPQRYWVPPVPHMQYDLMQIRHPYQNGGFFPQRVGYPSNRRTPIPEYFRQGSVQAKRSPMKKRGSVSVEETLL